MNNSVTPIKASDKLQKLFARDNRLIDVVAGHSPQLAKLRNSPMRRIMARVTTVAQVARLCNIPTELLVSELNLVLGIETVPNDIIAANETAALLEDLSSLPSLASAVELDVRDDLSKGGEPFSRIMAAVADLGESQVLHLRAPFEPVPLLAVMQKRGFDHKTEQHATGDWSVWFFRRNTASQHPVTTQPRATHIPNGSIKRNDGDTAIDAGRPEVRLDVRDLEPPEPLVRTLEALESLPIGSVLLQVNMRIPQFLLPILKERGFHFTIDESQPNEVQVRIWRNE